VDSESSPGDFLFNLALILQGQVKDIQPLPFLSVIIGEEKNECLTLQG
jgi:hypothetical protein